MSTPFPLNVTCTTISATTTSSSARLPDGGTTVLVKNPGSVEAFVASGVNSATATTSGMSILPGTVEPFTIPEGHTHIAGMTSSGSTTLRVYRAYGQ